jgi:hypothetical protein
MRPHIGLNGCGSSTYARTTTAVRALVSLSGQSVALSGQCARLDWKGNITAFRRARQSFRLDRPLQKVGADELKGA